MKNVNVIFQQWRIYNSKLLIAAIYSLVQTYKNTHTHNPTRVCFHEHRLRPFWNKQNPIYIQWWQYAFSMWKSSTKHLLCHNPHSIHLPIATIVNVYTICRNINEQQDNQNNDDQKKKRKKWQHKCTFCNSQPSKKEINAEHESTKYTIYDIFMFCGALFTVQNTMIHEHEHAPSNESMNCSLSIFIVLFPYPKHSFTHFTPYFWILYVNIYQVIENVWHSFDCNQHIQHIFDIFLHY